MGVSSDSWYHLRVSQKYSETLGVPQNSPDTYKWRDIEHIPYLYFWINGRILNLNEYTFQFNEVIVLRIINIFYSLGFVVGTYLLSKEFFKNKWLRIIPVVLLTNTLMFLFLSGSINYDNLANLCCVFSLLFFVRMIKNTGDARNPLLMLILLCLGTLTKYTIMPLAFILVLLTAIEVCRNWSTWKKSLKWKSFILIVPLVILGILNLGVYGINIVKYHSLVPDCLDVLTYEQCMQNGVFVRDNVTIPSVEVNLIDMISSGDRLDPVRYTCLWVWEMTKRVVGIMGDRSLLASNVVTVFNLLFISIAIFFGIKNWKGYDKSVKYVNIACLFYLFILLFFQNYTMYLERGIPTLALQGRYMFPVLSVFYILYVLFLSKIQNKKFRVLIFTLLILLFVASAIPYFILCVDTSWFGSIEY